MDRNPAQFPESTSIQPSSGAVPAESVREQLDRILASAVFQSAGRLQRFLRFVVEQAVSERGEILKEYRVALEVFDRPDSFNPRIDSVVRVAARQLRSKLHEYYDTDGAGDPVIIELPKGGYHPVFRFRSFGASQDVLSEEGTGPIPAGTQPKWRLGSLRTWLYIAVTAGVAACVGAAIYVWRHPRAEPIATIAVLPFDNYTTDPDLAYFCEGIVEELTDQLANRTGLKVLARTTSGQFKKVADPVAEARRVHVDAVVEGSVRRSGNRIRVSAQLIGTAKGFHLWSQTFERELSDSFTVQDEIVAGILKIFNAGRPGDSEPRRVSGSQEATRLYWAGRYVRRQRRPDAFPKAAELFSRAVDKDANYAQAWAALGDVYAMMGFHEMSGASPSEYVAKARRALQRSLELAPDLAEAHGSLATIAFYHDLDWPAAERGYSRALQLNPSSSKLHYFYGLGLVSQGRFEEGVNEAANAVALDPLSHVVSNDQAAVLYIARKYRDSRRLVQNALSTDPNFAAGHALLGCLESVEGRFDKSIASFQKAIQLSERFSYLLGHLGHDLAASGNTGAAIELARELTEARDQSGISYVHVAYIYAGLNDRDRAFDTLAKAIPRRDADVPFIAVDPMLDNLHSDARFALLLKQAGLRR